MRNNEQARTIAAFCFLMIMLIFAGAFWSSVIRHDHPAHGGTFDPNELSIADLSILFEQKNEQDFYLHSEQWDPPSRFVGQLVGITDPNQAVQLDIIDINALTEETIVRVVESGRLHHIRGPVQNCPLCKYVNHDDVVKWK